MAGELPVSLASWSCSRGNGFAMAPSSLLRSSCETMPVGTAFGSAPSPLAEEEEEEGEEEEGAVRVEWTAVCASRCCRSCTTLVDRSRDGIALCSLRGDAMRYGEGENEPRLHALL